jgi:alpha-aminoadipate carrier protein LysW
LTIIHKIALDFLSDHKQLYLKLTWRKRKMPTTACPECSEDVYVDADSEQGDVVSCDECGTDLEIVGLDPIELDIHEDDIDDFKEDVDEYEY